MKWKFSCESALTQNELLKEARKPWIGIDLDGTLAKYDKFEGWDKIGDPVPKAVEFVKDMLDRGIEVRILTARASAFSRSLNNISFEQVEEVIQNWTEKHIGVKLPVVTEKDANMLCFLDDSAVQISQNKGVPVAGDDGYAPFMKRIEEATSEEYKSKHTK